MLSLLVYPKVITLIGFYCRKPTVTVGELKNGPKLRDFIIYSKKKSEVTKTSIFNFDFKVAWPMTYYSTFFY